MNLDPEPLQPGATIGLLGGGQLAQMLVLAGHAMGFRFRPKVEFDFMHLDDPAAMTQLMINLADRNIISDELVQRNAKADPAIERKRLANEEKRRNI